MTNRPFPPSTRRASRPFELIHSYLKSFPIDSYHKYRYTIVFFDDYTSSTWTVNLRTKDAALTATSQFLALVENNAVRCLDPALPSSYHMSVLGLLGQEALALFYSVGTADTRTRVFDSEAMNDLERAWENAILVPRWRNSNHCYAFAAGSQILNP